MQRWFDRVIRFFLYVLMFWLPYSPAVIESCVVVSVVLWMIKRFFVFSKENTFAWSKQWFISLVKAFRLPSSPLNGAIGFFVLVCLLSILGSAQWQVSLRNFITKTLEWFAIYFLILEVMTERKYIMTMLALMAITTAATAFDSLIQFYVTYKDIFLGHTIQPGDRPTAAFQTPNNLGGYLALTIPVVGAWGITQWKPRLAPLSVVSFFTAVWSMVLTGSRGAWVGLGAGSIVFLIISFIVKKNSYLGNVVY